MGVYNIRDHGAAGNGIEKDTEALQKSIDLCTQNGGGMVLVPVGTYLCGTFEIKSNVEIHLEPGAVILCSTDRKDIEKGEYAEDRSGLGAFIKAVDAENIAITGFGVIDGQGDSFMEPDNGEGEWALTPYNPRPTLCIMKGCRNVTLSDVTFRRSAFWGLHFMGCDTMNIRDIKILNSLRGPNTDGIDPDACKNVHISDCHIEAGDDCIVIKNHRHAAEEYGACENITVTNCTLISRSSAIKIGTETSGDIRNCVFSNCVIRDSNRGLGVWVRDGATIENILFSDMIIETRFFDKGSNGRQWWGKAEPIFLSAVRRNQERLPGKIRNITFRNIQARGEGCIFAGGCEESIIEGLTLENIKLEIYKPKDHPGGLFDLSPSSMGVFEHDIPGIFAEYVKNLKIKDLELVWGQETSPKWTNGLYCENIENLEITGFKGQAADQGLPVMELNKIQGLTVKECKTILGSTIFMSLKEVNADEMIVMANDFSKATKAVKFADEDQEFFSFGNRMPKGM